MDRCHYCGRELDEYDVLEQSRLSHTIRIFTCSGCRHAETIVVRCAACGKDTADDEGACVWCKAPLR
jgi:hypothetical protein